MRLCLCPDKRVYLSQTKGCVRLRYKRDCIINYEWINIFFIDKWFFGSMYCRKRVPQRTGKQPMKDHVYKYYPAKGFDLSFFFFSLCHVQRGRLGSICYIKIFDKKLIEVLTESPFYLKAPPMLLYMQILRKSSAGNTDSRSQVFSDSTAWTR